MGPLPVEAVETLPFNPPLPFLALALALLAVPAARAVRRLGAETAHRPWPAGWDGGQAARHATGGLLAFIGLCLAPVALQPAAVALPGAVGRELAWLAQAAWGALVLLGPLLWALAQVAELRWPATALRALTAVALAPLGAVMAAGWAPPGVAAAIGLALAAAAPTLRRQGLRRWRAWRRPVVQVTRRSRLPELLAARDRAAAMDAPTRRTPWPPSGVDTV